MVEELSKDQKAEYARYIASHREKVPGVCEYCRAAFTGYPGKRFCSGQHRALYYYHEKKRREPTTAD